MPSNTSVKAVSYTGGKRGCNELEPARLSGAGSIIICTRHEYGNKSRAMRTDMVALHTGQRDSKRIFRVHKKLLCNKIPNFDKVFNCNFQKAKGDVAYFLEEDRETTDLLIEWVYQGTIRRLERKINGARLESSSWNFGEVYGLVDKLCLPDLQDEIIDEISGSLRGKDILPTFDLMAKFYNQAPRSSPLRCYMVFASYWMTLTVSERNKDIYTGAELHATMCENSESGRSSVDLLLDP
ncbi:uncharacterized protein PAC_17029 [Phialocephala subalpina]|uniref:BTB domain-containing protein n=1 Tax=Phialocephala subalpina TaxID=576137 RepID=A0A1L7XQ20_9HELO|nr:uncharacterized protein PAC_17029 [Phialocephala subalpina]